MTLRVPLARGKKIPRGRPQARMMMEARGGLSERLITPRLSAGRKLKTPCRLSPFRGFYFYSASAIFLPADLRFPRVTARVTAHARDVYARIYLPSRPEDNRVIITGGALDSESIIATTNVVLLEHVRETTA